MDHHNNNNNNNNSNSSNEPLTPARLIKRPSSHLTLQNIETLNVNNTNNNTTGDNMMNNASGDQRRQQNGVTAGATATINNNNNNTTNNSDTNTPSSLANSPTLPNASTNNNNSQRARGGSINRPPRHRSESHASVRSNNSTNNYNNSGIVPTSPPLLNQTGNSFQAVLALAGQMLSNNNSLGGQSSGENSARNSGNHPNPLCQMMTPPLSPSMQPVSSSSNSGAQSQTIMGSNSAAQMAALTIGSAASSPSIGANNNNSNNKSSVSPPLGQAGSGGSGGNANNNQNDNNSAPLFGIVSSSASGTPQNISFASGNRSDATTHANDSGHTNNNNNNNNQRNNSTSPNIQNNSSTSHLTATGGANPQILVSENTREFVEGNGSSTTLQNNNKSTTSPPAVTPNMNLAVNENLRRKRNRSHSGIGITETRAAGDRVHNFRSAISHLPPDTTLSSLLRGSQMNASVTSNNASFANGSFANNASFGNASFGMNTSVTSLSPQQYSLHSMPHAMSSSHAVPSSSTDQQQGMVSPSAISEQNSNHNNNNNLSDAQVTSSSFHRGDISSGTATNTNSNNNNINSDQTLGGGTNSNTGSFLHRMTIEDTSANDAGTNNNNNSANNSGQHGRVSPQARLRRGRHSAAVLGQLIEAAVSGMEENNNNNNNNNTGSATGSFIHQNSNQPSSSFYNSSNNNNLNNTQQHNSFTNNNNAASAVSGALPSHQQSSIGLIQHLSPQHLASTSSPAHSTLLTPNVNSNHNHSSLSPMSFNHNNSYLMSGALNNQNNNHNHSIMTPLAPVINMFVNLDEIEQIPDGMGMSITSIPDFDDDDDNGENNNGGNNTEGHRYRQLQRNQQFRIDEDDDDDDDDAERPNLDRMHFKNNSRKALRGSEPSEEIEPYLDRVEESQLSSLLLSQLEIRMVPSRIFNFTWIRSLTLAHNNLQTVPPELFTCLPVLESCDLSENDIDTIPDELYMCRTLLSLMLDHNSLREFGENRNGASEWGLEHLTELGLEWNYISLFPANVIRFLPNISHLYLAENPSMKLNDEHLDVLYSSNNARDIEQRNRRMRMRRRVARRLSSGGDAVSFNGGIAGNNNNNNNNNNNAPASNMNIHNTFSTTNNDDRQSDENNASDQHSSVGISAIDGNAVSNSRRESEAGSIVSGHGGGFSSEPQVGSGSSGQLVSRISLQQHQRNNENSSTSPESGNLQRDISSQSTGLILPRGQQQAFMNADTNQTGHMEMLIPPSLHGQYLSQNQNHHHPDHLLRSPMTQTEDGVNNNNGNSPAGTLDDDDILGRSANDTLAIRLDNNPIYKDKLTPDIIDSLRLEQHINIDWNEIFPDKILENLFLGALKSVQSASVFDAVGITHVLTAARDIPVNPVPGIVHKQLLLDDFPGEDITRCFGEAHEFINSARCRGCRERIAAQRAENNDDNDDDTDEQKEPSGVVVHCFQGASRSATIVVSYLMRMLDLPFQEAFNLARARRHQVNPNGGYISNLKKYETYLRRQEGRSLSKTAADYCNARADGSTDITCPICNAQHQFAGRVSNSAHGQNGIDDPSEDSSNNNSAAQTTSLSQNRNNNNNNRSSNDNSSASRNPGMNNNSSNNNSNFTSIPLINQLPTIESAGNSNVTTSEEISSTQLGAVDGFGGERRNSGSGAGVFSLIGNPNNNSGTSDPDGSSGNHTGFFQLHHRSSLNGNNDFSPGGSMGLPQGFESITTRPPLSPDQRDLMSSGSPASSAHHNQHRLASNSNSNYNNNNQASTASTEMSSNKSNIMQSLSLTNNNNNNNNNSNQTTTSPSGLFDASLPLATSNEGAAAGSAIRLFRKSGGSPKTSLNKSSESMGTNNNNNSSNNNSNNEKRSTINDDDYENNNTISDGGLSQYHHSSNDNTLLGANTSISTVGSRNNPTMTNIINMEPVITSTSAATTMRRSLVTTQDSDCQQLLTPKNINDSSNNHNNNNGNSSSSNNLNTNNSPQQQSHHHLVEPPPQSERARSFSRQSMKRAVSSQDDEIEKSGDSGGGDLINHSGSHSTQMFNSSSANTSAAAAVSKRSGGNVSPSTASTSPSKPKGRDQNDISNGSNSTSTTTTTHEGSKSSAARVSALNEVDDDHFDDEQPVQFDIGDDIKLLPTRMEENIRNSNNNKAASSSSSNKNENGSSRVGNHDRHHLLKTSLDNQATAAVVTSGSAVMTHRKPASFREQALDAAKKGSMRLMPLPPIENGNNPQNHSHHPHPHSQDDLMSNNSTMIMSKSVNVVGGGSRSPSGMGLVLDDNHIVQGRISSRQTSMINRPNSQPASPKMSGLLLDDNHHHHNNDLVFKTSNSRMSSKNLMTSGEGQPFVESSNNINHNNSSPEFSNRGGGGAQQQPPNVFSSLQSKSSIRLNTADPHVKSSTARSFKGDPTSSTTSTNNNNSSKNTQPQHNNNSTANSLPPLLVHAHEQSHHASPGASSSSPNNNQHQQSARGNNNNNGSRPTSSLSSALPNHSNSSLTHHNNNNNMSRNSTNSSSVSPPPHLLAMTGVTSGRGSPSSIHQKGTSSNNNKSPSVSPGHGLVLGMQSSIPSNGSMPNLLHHQTNSSNDDNFPSPNGSVKSNNDASNNNNNNKKQSQAKRSPLQNRIPVVKGM